MKKRRIVSLVLATVLGASMVLGGCGSKGGSDASNTEGASGESKGKITIFQQKTEIYDQLKELAKDYEKETGVEVEVWQISGDDYYQNLKTICQVNPVLPYFHFLPAQRLRRCPLT